MTEKWYGQEYVTERQTLVLRQHIKAPGVGVNFWVQTMSSDGNIILCIVFGKRVQFCCDRNGVFSWTFDYSSKNSKEIRVALCLLGFSSEISRGSWLCFESHFIVPCCPVCTQMTSCHCAVIRDSLKVILGKHLEFYSKWETHSIVILRMEFRRKRMIFVIDW